MTTAVEEDGGKKNVTFHRLWRFVLLLTPSANAIVHVEEVRRRQHRMQVNSKDTSYNLARCELRYEACSNKLAARAAASGAPSYMFIVPAGSRLVGRTADTPAPGQEAANQHQMPYMKANPFTDRWRRRTTRGRGKMQTHFLIANAPEMNSTNNHRAL